MLQAQDMRYQLAQILHTKMQEDKRIWVVTGDLGHKLWDKIRADFPDRFLNTGASEQAMMGLGVGLALKGCIPILYSITPFLIYRPFETIRNYIHHEKIPVKLIASGRGQDYENEGFSHWAEEDHEVMKILSNIEAHWPEENHELERLANQMLKSPKPWYINLKRLARCQNPKS